MRKNGWIIKVNNSYVDNTGKLTEDRQAAHRWHYKKDAEMNTPRWQNKGTVSVEEYESKV